MRCQLIDFLKLRLSIDHTKLVLSRCQFAPAGEFCAEERCGRVNNDDRESGLAHHACSGLDQIILHIGSKANRFQTGQWRPHSEKAAQGHTVKPRLMDMVRPPKNPTIY